MSYECDLCGKISVEKYGQWCNECQEREHELSMEADALFYNSMRLCMRCQNLFSENHCIIYSGMPNYFFRRKNKCKYFEVLKW
ncbi:hypothetical protein ES702_06206 [subsurface metagenome]